MLIADRCTRIGDDEDLYGIVARLMDAGSRPGATWRYRTWRRISRPEKMAADERSASTGSSPRRALPTARRRRSHASSGLELVEPGMVRIQQWRPRSEIEAKSAAATVGRGGAQALSSPGRERVLRRRRARPAVAPPSTRRRPGRGTRAPACPGRGVASVPSLGTTTCSSAPGRDRSITWVEAPRNTSRSTMAGTGSAPPGRPGREGSIRTRFGPDQRVREAPPRSTSPRSTGQRQSRPA